MDTILIIEAKMTNEQLEVLVSEIKKISEIIAQCNKCGWLAASQYLIMK